jgi:hypothetical protein
MVPLSTLALLLSSGAAFAGYSVTNPVPASEMRPLSTDRPDVSESPFTVDAGHVQVELDFFSVAHESVGNLDFDQLGILTSNVKFGLSDNVDLQLVLRPYVRAEVSGSAFGSAVSASESGIGDTDIRVKINLKGNDGGSAAIALLPFVSLATASDGLGAPDASYGLAVPLALQLEGGTTMSVMAQATGTKDASALLFSTSFSRTLAGSLGGFVELAGTRPSANGRSLDWITTFDTGLTLGITSNVQLDGAVLIGLTEAATDLTGYVGLSVRR